MVELACFRLAAGKKWWAGMTLNVPACRTFKGVCVSDNEDLVRFPSG